MALELSKTNHKDKFTELKPLTLFDKKKEVSSIDLMTVSNVFCVVSKQRRKELTEDSTINPKVKIDIHKNREFRTPMGYHVIISGPLLSHFDATVSSVLVGIYFEKNCQQGLVRCSWAEIVRKLGKSTTSGSVREDVHRSLTRLKECNLKIYNENGTPLWVRSLIQDIKTEGNGRGLQLVIQLNDWMVPLYNDGKYSIQQLTHLILLSGEYQPALYRILTTSEDKILDISLEDVYDFVVEKGNKYLSYSDLPVKKKENFKTLMKKQLVMMIKKNVIHPDSCVVGSTLHLVSSVLQ